MERARLLAGRTQRTVSAANGEPYPVCVWATDTTSGRARWIGPWMQNAAGLIVA